MGIDDGATSRFFYSPLKNLGGIQSPGNDMNFNLNQNQSNRDGGQHYPATTYHTLSSVIKTPPLYAMPFLTTVCPTIRHPAQILLLKETCVFKQFPQFLYLLNKVISTCHMLGCLTCNIFNPSHYFRSTITS